MNRNRQDERLVERMYKLSISCLHLMSYLCHFWLFPVRFIVTTLGGTARPDHSHAGAESIFIPSAGDLFDDHQRVH